MKYTKEWGLQICTKQHGVWGRLYFPKLAREVSPILRALLQHDPSTRHDAIESDFPALESELAIVTVLKAVRGNRTDTEIWGARSEKTLQHLPCSLEICSPDTPPWGVLPLRTQWYATLWKGQVQRQPCAGALDISFGLWVITTQALDFTWRSVQVILVPSHSSHLHFTSEAPGCRAETGYPQYSLNRFLTQNSWA